MMAMPALAALYAVILGLSDDGSTAHNKACPCLGTRTSDFIGDGFCMNFTAGQKCIQSNYGSQCLPWDMMANSSHPLCRGDRPASWCNAKWCYVNSSACERPFKYSTLAVGLAYSYATCGNLDTYSPEDRTKALRSREIRKSYPSTSPNGYTLVHVDGQVRGAIPDFAERLFDSIRADTTVVPISEGSLSRFDGNQYSACTHDVALNNTDVCVGDFWVTAERLSWGAGFTPALYDEKFYAIVYVTDDGQDWWDQIQRPFRPFQGMLWLAIFSCICFNGFALWYVEDDSGHYRMMDKGQAARVIAGGILGSINALVLTAVRCAPCNKATTFSGRVTVVGFGLFVLIMVATYTANLASHLIVDQAHGGVTSLVEAVDNDWKICGISVLAQTLLSLHPEIRPLWVPVLGYTDSLAAMDDGRCKMAILPEDYMIATHAGTLGNTHCNKRMVGQPIFSLFNALPVSQELHQEFTWLVSKYIENGVWGQLKESEQARWLPNSKCGRASKSEKGQGLPVEFFGGPLLISMLCSLVALVASHFDDWNEIKNLGKAARSLHALAHAEHEAATKIGKIHRGKQARREVARMKRTEHVTGDNGGYPPQGDGKDEVDDVAKYTKEDIV